MKNIKNIAIGKIGKSVKFDPKKFNAVGGDNEAPALFTTLARKNPHINFYMIGKSDLRLLKEDVKKELDLPSNLIDVWEGFDPKINNNMKYAFEKLKANNIVIDAGIFYNGPSSSSNVPNVMKKNDGTFAKPLEMFKNYVGPIVSYLNDSNIPYITLGPDPRYIPIGAYDLINREKLVLSQFNCEEEITHIKSYDDLTLLSKKINVRYSGIEKVFFLSQKKNDITKMKKSKKMLIVLNEGGNGGLKRGPLLKEYILDFIDDIEIYGKWSDKWLEDPRFKGPKKFMELHPLLEDVKYTFIIPIQKGWVTAKFWEMINYGVIPFMHPYYDEQCHIDCPEFLRIKSPEDLKNKIEFLENNKNEYEKLLHQLNEMLLEEYYNGDYINKIVMSSLNEI